MESDGRGFALAFNKTSLGDFFDDFIGGGFGDGDGFVAKRQLKVTDIGGHLVFSSD